MVPPTRNLDTSSGLSPPPKNFDGVLRLTGDEVWPDESTGCPTHFGRHCERGDLSTFALQAVDEFGDCRLGDEMRAKPVQPLHHLGPRLERRHLIDLLDRGFRGAIGLLNPNFHELFVVPTDARTKYRNVAGVPSVRFGL